MVTDCCCDSPCVWICFSFCMLQYYYCPISSISHLFTHSLIQSPTRDRSFMHSLIHHSLILTNSRSLIHALTYSHSLTHSLTHSTLTLLLLTRSLKLLQHSLTHSLTHSIFLTHPWSLTHGQSCSLTLTYSLADPFSLHSLALTQGSLTLLTHSLTHSPTRSLTHSLAHSLTHSLTNHW